MKLLTLAICSLGIWVVLNSLLGAQSIWEDIVFGAITAILALISMFQIKELSYCTLITRDKARRKVLNQMELLPWPDSYLIVK